MKADFKNGIVLPTLQLPHQRRLTGGRNLDGSFWIEIEGQGRIVLPPDAARDMAINMLRALGWDIRETTPPPTNGHG